MTAMNALRQWRLSYKPQQLSLDQAGALLGVTGVQMYRYEHGLRRVPPEKVARYSRITGIPKSKLRPDIFGFGEEAERSRGYIALVA